MGALRSLGVLAGAVGAVALGAGAVAGAVAGSAAPTTVDGIPPAMALVYREAAATCPGLPWTVLAAVGTVESANGTSTLPGVHAGANPAGAEGPMQMEPATFAAYDLPVPPGGAVPPDPYDSTDAVFAAARDLCANGAAGGADLRGALYAYNHSWTYVDDVLALAAADAGTGSAPAAVEALDYALAQVGTPYRYGGTSPTTGFDCSGLAQAAYALAGIGLPRTAQAQAEAGPAVAPGAPLQPGDLVFFGTGPDAVDHVGLVVDPAGTMVDAPHTGATVRVESFPTQQGAAWGDERYLGATRPAAGAG